MNGKKFQTIRETAAGGLLTENHIRELVHRGRCPGVWAGRRFLVNVPLLSEQLDEESRRAVGPEPEEDGRG